MAQLKIDAVKLASKLSSSLQTNIQADFVASQGKRKVLTKSFNEAIKQKVFDAAFVVVPVTAHTLRAGYVGMLTDIADQLAAGFPNTQGYREDGEPLIPSDDPESWSPFVKKYWKQKRRQKPGTENIFWRFTGGLSRSMRSFATTQARAAGYFKDHGVYRVKIGSNTYQGVRLAQNGFVKSSDNLSRRYRLEFYFELPEITQSAYRDALFRVQFLNPGTKVDLRSVDETAKTFQRIMYNEPIRSWLRKRVITHGLQVQQEIRRTIRQQLR